MTERESLRKLFSTRLKAARTANGFSQRRLAVKADLCQTVIAHFESGRRTPQVPNLVALAKALEVSTDYLLGLSSSLDT